MERAHALSSFVPPPSPSTFCAPMVRARGGKEEHGAPTRPPSYLGSRGKEEGRCLLRCCWAKSATMVAVAEAGCCVAPRGQGKPQPPELLQTAIFSNDSHRGLAVSGLWPVTGPWSSNWEPLAYWRRSMKRTCISAVRRRRS